MASLVPHLQRPLVHYGNSSRRGRHAQSRSISVNAVISPPATLQTSTSGRQPEPHSSSFVSPVEVRVYNIDRYGLAKLGSAVLKKKVDAIWHVGIAAYGYEYWFDHKLNKENLALVDYAFGFGPTHTYPLGNTMKTREEFEEFVFGTLAHDYSIDRYDCFYHNCHHCANDMANFLTGQSIPEWCIKHGEDGLSELDKQDAEKIRWASNKIARIMMVAWGRYNKDRFIKKEAEQAQTGPDGHAQVAAEPVPAVIAATGSRQ